MTEKPDVLAPWRWFLIAHAGSVRAIEEDLVRGGAVSLTWYDVLLELNAAPGRRLRMTELANRVVLSRSRVSRVVDELAKAGLVGRQVDPDDRRSAFAVLTPAGRRELRRTAPLYRKGIDRHFLALLDEDERATIADALRRIGEHHRADAGR